MRKSDAANNVDYTRLLAEIPIPQHSRHEAEGEALLVARFFAESRVRRFIWIRFARSIGGTRFCFSHRVFGQDRKTVLFPR